MDKIKAQNAEFKAAENFAEVLKIHNQTAVVDDDYPRVRYAYESALTTLMDAMRDNGRFSKGNRYGLKNLEEDIGRG